MPYMAPRQNLVARGYPHVLMRTGACLEVGSGVVLLGPLHTLEQLHVVDLQLQ